MYEESSIVKFLQKKKDDWWVVTTKDWERSYGDGLLCPECWKLKSEVHPDPVDIRLRQLPKGRSYDGVFRGGVAVIQDELLEWLRPYMRDFTLGGCFWEDGSRIPGYHTIYLWEMLLTRGGQDSEHYVCGTCGTVLDGWGTTPYVLRSEMPDGHVFQDRGRMLWFNASLARKFPWKHFEKYEPFMIPVRDEPLPDDPLPSLG